MNFFNKLPGHIQTPSGYEWLVLKKIPRIFLICTALPSVVMLTLYLGNASINRDQEQVIYLCLGLLFTAWFFIGTVTIGCVVVMIMKGPAYVADPYELPEENNKLEPRR
jgi:hypothetical protein